MSIAPEPQSPAQDPIPRILRRHAPPPTSSGVTDAELPRTGMGPYQEVQLVLDYVADTGLTDLNIQWRGSVLDDPDPTVDGDWYDIGAEESITSFPGAGGQNVSALTEVVGARWVSPRVWHTGAAGSADYTISIVRSVRAGPTGATGPAGAAGATGPAGTNGTNGTSPAWLSGSGTPAGGLGAVGDWYLNEDNGDVYEKTGASTWTLQTNIQGADGAAGATGSTGAAGQGLAAGGAADAVLYKVDGTDYNTAWRSTEAQLDAAGTTRTWKRADQTSQVTLDPAVPGFHNLTGLTLAGLTSGKVHAFRGVLLLTPTATGIPEVGATLTGNGGSSVFYLAVDYPVNTAQGVERSAVTASGSMTAPATTALLGTATHAVPFHGFFKPDSLGTLQMIGDSQTDDVVAEAGGYIEWQELTP